MKAKTILYICLHLLIATSCNLTGQTNHKIENMKYNPLSDEEKAVILHKGTEYPGSGELLNNKAEGLYLCRQCDAPLYTSESKFESFCGWPSFDDEIEGAVKRVPDADGRRTEIVCAKCGGHLGHVFLGEGFTLKDTRHCVNSISMKFVPASELQVSKAYFASGCFWGTEYYFQKLKGVTKTTVGFMGGHVDAPSYRQVCEKNTGHLETIEIEYNPKEVNYDKLVKYFFETHDFTQTDGQGPDIGPQYLSAIFYGSDEEKTIAEENINILTTKGYKVATKLIHKSTFWDAEDYHQQYYEHKGETPYCHKYTKIF